MLFRMISSLRSFCVSLIRLYSVDIINTMQCSLAANLGMLFNEIPQLKDRYEAASACGFKYVECGFPYESNVDEIAAARKNAAVEHVLINSFPGNTDKGEFGLASIPSKREEFFETLELSIQYANALECKRMHIMAGTAPMYSDTSRDEVYVENLQYAADRLQKEGITGVIEVINPKSVPKYYLNSLDKAIECVEKVNHPNMRLMFDCYHIQVLHGNLTHNLTKAFPYLEHVQIAQAPDRGEPGDNGEINYKYILKLLEEMSYKGYVGLEYKPRGETKEGLRWIKEFGIQF